MTDCDPSLMAVALVDEEIGRLALLTRIVEQAGYIAVPAHGGRKALKLFAMVRPQLVVIHADLTTDITAADLSAEFSSPPSRVPVVVIAHEPKPWFASGKQRLVSDYLILPFTAYHLLHAIRRLLSVRGNAPADCVPPTGLVF